MKSLMSLIILLTSSMSWATVCDLTANNNRIAELNRQFDAGNMRGEEHLIELTLARRDRATQVENCLLNDMTEGLSRADLLNTKQEIQSNHAVTMEEFREQIEYQISMDRMGMATQLMMDRDLEKLRVANLVALIDRLVRK